MNDKVDFTQTAARKGDDGGSDFEPFISPLTEVAGQPVDLSHLLDLHFVPPNESAPVPLLSSYLRAILTATADQVAIRSSGGPMMPIRLGDVFRQMVGSRADRPFDQFAPFYEQLNGPEAEKKINPWYQDGIEPVDTEKFRGMVLDGGVTSVLAIASIEASALRQTNRGRIGLRHFTLALLLTLEGREMLWWSGFAEGTPAPQINTITSGLRKVLQDQSYYGDNGQTFEARLNAAGDQYPEPSVPQPRQVSDDRYVPDKPVLTLAGDQLGFADEVQALARIVALKEPGPPLAVGLFGDWGSGKSSFMNMLEDSIEQTCAQARETDATEGVFVKEVVHIKFNAWVYNDADLWSSLTAETFRQLRLGGSKQRGSAALKSVMDDLTKFVASSDNVAAKAEADLIDKRDERDRLRDEIDQAEEEAFQSRLELLANAASATIDDYKTKDELTRVDKALAAVGATFGPIEDDDEAERRVSGLSREIENAAGFAGHVATYSTALVRAISFAGPAAVWLWTAIVLALSFYLLVPWGKIQTELLPSIGMQGAWLEASGVAWTKAVATITAAAVPLRKIYQLVEPILRSSRKFKSELATAESTAQDGLEKKRKELAKAQKEVADLEKQRDQATAKADKFRDADPAAVLSYFLQQSEETSSFDANLGIVSKVRNVFEKLQEIIETAQKDGNAPIDRIVLYIDDLDRCRAETVVSVLEAVHLLMAMDLFVVVVGVDSRWLTRALESELLLKPNKESTTETATPKDYLEKIFQIPIRLGRLQTDQASFGQFVESVSGPQEVAEVAAPPPIVVNADDGMRMTIEALDEEVPPLARAAAESLEAVLLKPWEVELTKSLGELLGRSPRAVKKFVNLYRMVRGLRSGDDLERFLAPNNVEEANYATTQFWLAADCGLSSATMRTLREAVSFVPEDSEHTIASYFGGLHPPLDPTDVLDDDKKQRREKDIRDRRGAYHLWENISQADATPVYRALGQVNLVLGAMNNVSVLRHGMAESARFSSSM